MYLINGKEVEKENFNVPIEDLVVWRGDGIFEAIRIHDGFLFALDKLFLANVQNTEHLPVLY